MMDADQTKPVDQTRELIADLIARAERAECERNEVNDLAETTLVQVKRALALAEQARDEKLSAVNRATAARAEADAALAQADVTNAESKAALAQAKAAILEVVDARAQIDVAIAATNAARVETEAAVVLANELRSEMIVLRVELGAAKNGDPPPKTAKTTTPTVFQMAKISLQVEDRATTDCRYVVAAKLLADGSALFTVAHCSSSDLESTFARLKARGFGNMKATGNGDEDDGRGEQHSLEELFAGMLVQA
jgi:hypothetical protein